MSENDTFNRLRRSDFSTVRKDVISGGLVTGTQLNKILNKHYWDVNEYQEEVRKHYEHITRLLGPGS